MPSTIKAHRHSKVPDSLLLCNWDIYLLISIRMAVGCFPLLKLNSLIFPSSVVLGLADLKSLRKSFMQKIRETKKRRKKKKRRETTEFFR